MKKPILPPLPVIKSVTDMRYQSREIVNTLVKEQQTIYLTKDSNPIGVLIPLEKYKSIQSYISSLEDQIDAATLDKAIEESSHDFVDFEEFDKEQRKKRGLPPYVPTSD